MAPFVKRSAAIFGARVTLLHVFDLYSHDAMQLYARPPSEVAEEQWNLARDKLHSFLKSEFPISESPRIVLSGHAPTQITQLSRRKGFDLIIMPTHAGFFRSTLLGSTTAKVLNHADCPVMTTQHAETISPIRQLRRLRRANFPVDTVQLAHYLIGKVLVHDIGSVRLSARIVETEAYPIGDPAGHAFRGKTPRNSSLFLEPGHAYVYFTYGSSFLLNVSSEVAGVGGGVLLRAIEPLDGIEIMAGFRGTTRVTDLGRGPGRLTKAMRVDLRQDGLDLCAAGPLWLAASTQRTGAIGKSARIGLTQNVNRLLRFYERGNPHVSGSKRLRK